MGDKVTLVGELICAYGTKGRESFREACLAEPGIRGLLPVLGILGKREGDQRVTQLFSVDLCVSAGCNHDVLLPFDFVGHWRSVSWSRQLCLPKFLAGFGVERADVWIERGSGDEH